MSKRRKSTWQCLSSLPVVILALAPSVAPADTFTFTCGDPSFPGTIGITVNIGVPITQVSLAKTVTIAAGASAADKCSAIAAAFPDIARANGNVVTFQDQALPSLTLVRGGIITSDLTGESNSLSALVAPAEMVSLIEVPIANPSVVPPAGTTFSGSLSAPAFTPFTFGAVADGTKSEVSLFNQLNNQITTNTGLTFFPITIPTGPTSFVTGFESNPFDPNSVTISWDANIGSDLANFGLVVEPAAAVPEPVTVPILGAFVIAVALLRRKLGRVEVQ